MKKILFIILLFLSLHASADDSGNCGDGATFYYNEATQTLTISGEGPMYNYSHEFRPWNTYCSKISNVIIEPGITSICSWCFFSCKSLTSITLPNTLSSISDFSFYGCSNLTSIKIPEGVTSIGQQAFFECYNLSSVFVPNSLNGIGYSAFEGCNKSLVIIVAVKDVSGFCNNKIISIIYNNIGKPVKLIDNDGNEINSLKIPNDVTSIGSYAFYNCSCLNSLIIPNNVVEIGNNAFSGCNIKKTIWLSNTPPLGCNNAQGIVNYVSNDQFTSLSNTTKYQFLSSYFDVDGIRYVPVSP